MGTLISGCNLIKQKEGFKTNIIADGGIKTYDQIIKALALGADYVMIGRMLAQTEEACSEERWVCDKTPFTSPLIDRQHKDVYSLDTGYLDNPYKHKERLYYGMSTKRAQKEMAEASGKTDVKLKTAEGIEYWVPITYTLDSFLENFQDYLRSAMSYTNSKSMAEDFIGNVEMDNITEREFKAYYK